MRVCFVSHSSKLGGAERVLLETVEVLKHHGVDCRVILPGLGEFSEALNCIDVPIAVVPGHSWVEWGNPSAWMRLKAALKIARATVRTVGEIKRWNCDLAYSNTVTICSGALAAAWLKLPHVWHLHEFGYEDHGLVFDFGDALSYWILRSSSVAYIAVSHCLAKKYERYLEPAKISVIYPSMHRALTTTSEHENECRPNRRFRCILIGGLVEGKGQEEAVRAFSLLPRNAVDAELLLVGDGDPRYRARLHEIADAASLQERVIFVGAVKDASALVRTCDAVLVCSRSEAFGRATVEGMLAGRPVIGAKAAATSELIRDGVNGLLYTHGHPEELAEKIAYLYQNPKAAYILGQNAKDWAQKIFTADRYWKELSPRLAAVAPMRERALSVHCASE